MTGRPDVTGWWLLLRLAARQDRLLVPVSVAVLVLMSVVSAGATSGLYADEADRVRAATAINASPAIVALYGPILDVGSEGELAMSKMTVLYAVFVAVLLIAVVRRHTRVEEESGRTELVGGTAVGRDAAVAATALEATCVATALGVLTALGNWAAGLDLAGSLAFGAVWAGTGLVAAGVGAVTAQLSASSRTCAAWAATTVGAFFVLRAVGDTGPSWVSWCSPLGWNTQVRAYGDTRWWILVLYPVLAVALAFVAVVLRRRRDLGSGLVAARPGPRTAVRSLAGPFGLSWRLHATMLLLWSASSAAMGVVFGMITPQLGDFLDSAAAEAVIDKLGGVLVAAVLSVIAVVLSYFAVAIVSHAAHDERDGRAEMVLATAASRSQWWFATVALALGGAAWLLLVTGLGLWVGYVVSDGSGVGNLLLASAAWIPAVWVVAALGVLSLAVGVRWTPVAWAWPGAFLTLGIVGDLLEVPGWVTGLSPYDHVPLVPAADWDWGSAAGLTGVAGALLVVAWWRFRSRDIG